MCWSASSFTLSPFYWLVSTIRNAHKKHQETRIHCPFLCHKENYSFFILLLRFLLPSTIIYFVSCPPRVLPVAKLQSVQWEANSRHMCCGHRHLTTAMSKYQCGNTVWGSYYCTLFKENKAGDVLVTLMCLRETIVAVEKQLVTYLFICVCVCLCACPGAWACACVALHIQHATRMRCIVLFFVACLAPPRFLTLSQKRYESRKKLVNIKCVFSFSLQLVCNNFPF